MCFFRKLSEMNIDYNKFNFSTKYSSEHLFNTDDNFWVFNRSLLEKFVNIIVFMKSHNRITHEINHYFTDDELHYMYAIDKSDYDNLTTNRYFFKNTYYGWNNLDKLIEMLKKHMGYNLSREFLCI